MNCASGSGPGPGNQDGTTGSSLEDANARPAEPWRICCVNVSPAIRRALQDQGHHVLPLNPEPGQTLHIPLELDRAGFHAQALLQQELLRDRVLLTGLGELDCPKAFWSVDPHLNAYWQCCYARLFDLIFSTQQRWIPDLQRAGARRVVWLPWYATPTPWTSWARRDVPLAFVGRVTAQRDVRARFIRTLSTRFDSRFIHAEDLTAQAMDQLYARTCIVPNESILGEVNFRLFEAIRRGCLVIGPDLGPEQARLFEPGREMLCFRHAADLLARTEEMLRRPDQAESIARAGWQRLCSAHGPGHRARTLVHALQNLSTNKEYKAATGIQADIWLAATACQMHRGGRLHGEARTFFPLLGHARAPSWIQALHLRMLAEYGAASELGKALARHAAHGDPADLETNAAASLAALRTGQHNTARALRLRWERTTGERHSQPCASPQEMARRWAATFRKAGQVMNPGFSFDEQSHVPASAMECLALALAFAPHDLGLTRQMEALLRDQPGYELHRVGLLSTLSLHARTDWRLGLELGLTNLRAFRFRAALEELLLARQQAEAQGATQRFDAALAGRDPDGQIHALLRD